MLVVMFKMEESGPTEKMLAGTAEINKRGWKNHIPIAARKGSTYIFPSLLFGNEYPELSLIEKLKDLHLISSRFLNKPKNLQFVHRSHQTI